MKDNIIISEAVITPKMIEHIEFFQDGENGPIEHFIDRCEAITNLLFRIGESDFDQINKDELFKLLNANNELRQILKDFKAPVIK